MTDQLLAACGSGLILIRCVFWHRNFFCTLQEPFTHEVEQQLTPLHAQRVRIRAPQLIYQAKKKKKKTCPPDFNEARVIPNWCPPLKEALVSHTHTHTHPPHTHTHTSESTNLDLSLHPAPSVGNKECFSFFSSSHLLLSLLLLLLLLLL